MNEEVHTAWKPRLLAPPTYAPSVLAGRVPTFREVLIEWIDALSFWKDRAKLLPAVYLAFHLTTAGVFVWFLIHHFSITALITISSLATIQATIYNTVWYHRYCSHRAFKFRSVWWARLFLWTNSICLREESYVVPHRVHHSMSDKPGDPYGPHLGWLGSYLGTESQQKMRRNLSPADYERLSKSLEHIGFLHNDHAEYERSGSVEKVWHWLTRIVFVNVFWCSLAWWLAGWWGVQAWLASVFFCSLLIRDFNFRGHAGYFGGQKPAHPLNQLFYGVIAGEWHDNHHLYPRLACSGLAWWQIDIPYLIIRLMHSLGIVTQYVKPAHGKEGTQGTAESADL
jgi:stearoyl-CoA desaturase (delta-9 desaturase)